MNASGRQRLLAGAMLVILALAALWTARWAETRRDEAMRSARSLAVCEQLLADIESLRAEPKTAAQQSISDHRLGRRIEVALQKANLDEDAWEGTYPQGPQSLPNSPYVRRPTVLELGGVSLLQLGNFLYHVTEDSQFRADELRLRTPRRSASRNQWDAEITLTYLVYAASEEGTFD